MARASFGLILANRAVVLGAIQARDLIELSQQAERSGAFDALWVGDSLLAKPRLEAVALLSALAGATSRLKLAVGCLATFVHRHPLLFAQQWASLDVLSGGRAWLAVCLGGPDEQSAAPSDNANQVRRGPRGRPAERSSILCPPETVAEESPGVNAGRKFRGGAAPARRAEPRA